jgi:hypothetical protein
MPTTIAIASLALFQNAIVARMTYEAVIQLKTYTRRTINSEAAANGR